MSRCSLRGAKRPSGSPSSPAPPLYTSPAHQPRPSPLATPLAPPLLFRRFPPAPPPGPAPPRAHRHQKRAATASAAAPATEQARISTAGRGRGEGSLRGRTPPPRPAGPTKCEAITAPAPRLQGGHVHRPGRHSGAQGGARCGRRGSPRGGEAQVQSPASLGEPQGGICRETASQHSKTGWGQGCGESDRRAGQGLTRLRGPLLSLKLGWGLEPGAPRLLPG